MNQKFNLCGLIAGVLVMTVGPLTVVSKRTGVEYWALYRIVRETNKRGGKQKNWEKLETFFKGVK